MTNEWTKEQNQTVLDLTNKGLSASQIGAAIGKSRNAVIGFWHRKNIKRRAAYIATTKKYAASLQASSAASVSTAAPAAKSKPPPMKFTSLPKIQNHSGFYLGDATRTNCRFVIGEPRHAIICGQQTKPRSSFCHSHHSIIWTRTK